MVTGSLIKLNNGDNTIDAVIRVSTRAKRIAIRISETRKVELVVPLSADLNIANKFLLAKEIWIRNHLDKLSNLKPKFKISNKIQVYGELYNIVFSNCSINGLIKIEEKTIYVSKEIQKANMPTVLSAYLKEIVKKDIEKYAELLSKVLKVKYNKINIRDTMRQWGSCSHSGNLSFSWRLVFAPRFVMEYLVVHELCHLIENNHSLRYWKLVGKICPDYSLAKTWLKNNGRELHHYLIPIV